MEMFKNTAEAPPLERRERLAAHVDAPDGLLVLLHGRGANKDDLYPVLDLIDPGQRLHVVTLQAPFQPFGQVGGWHWYEVKIVGAPERDAFHASMRLLHRDIDALLTQHGLTHQRLVLGGFSQGAVMAIAAAFAPGRPKPAAVLPWSGFVPTVEHWSLDPDAAAGVPVLLTHGALDPVIDVEFGHNAKALLEHAGADVTYCEPQIGHEIDLETVLAARALVLDRVPGQQRSS
jgi:phospholipase/carboxylesterase